MSCHVCGRELEVDTLIDDARGKGRFLVCAWCGARVCEIDGKEPTRFLYCAPYERWAAVKVRGTSGEHGLGPRSETLCGLDIGARKGVMRHLFRPGQEDACPKCVAFALELDARWPAGVHGKPGK